VTERITISADDLNTPEVDAAVARGRALRPRHVPDPEPVSPLRRLLLSSLFYLPIAGLLGAFGAWMIVEPSFHDFAVIGGPVTLVNNDPFEVTTGGVTTITVGRREVYLIPGFTEFEDGADGQAAYASVDRIGLGDMVEVAGQATDDKRIAAFGLRRATAERAKAAGQEVPEELNLAVYALFPLTAALITLAIFLLEGLTSRNFVRMSERMFVGTGLATLFALLSTIPADVTVSIGTYFATLRVSELDFVSAKTMAPVSFALFMASRSAAWAMVGAAAGAGMNMIRSTPLQLRNTLMGGALGGALGGLFFDPIARFVQADSRFASADLSRAVGLCAVGLLIGVFTALSERLAREAWIRVRTGPLAGKSFVLYRAETVLGSAPASDIYLFKDAQIDPRHAVIYRAGGHYEVEDLGSRHGTAVGDSEITRRRLASGDQIVLGATVVEFEERRKSGA